MGNQTAKPQGFSAAQTEAFKSASTNDFLVDFLDNAAKDIGPSPPPPQSSKDKGEPPKDELKKKIRAYNTNDFDSIFDEVSGQIDGDYDKNNKNTKKTKKSKNKKKSKTKHKSKVSHVIQTSSSQSLYVEEISNIRDKYSYRKQLGKGGTCRVLLCVDRETQKLKVALKELNKTDKYNEELFAKEIQLLRMLSDHENVVNFHAAYQSKHHYYLATQYCDGGTFLERILKLRKFAEKDAILYVKTILETVQFMHEQGIVHRDLKLNNMVFDKHGNEGVLKIIDFGDSDIVEDDNDYKELVGTLYYLSPECKRKRKGWEVKKSDMWSIGIICYILLSGKLPFSGNDQSSTFKLIEKAKFEWPDNVELSKSCKSFIAGLLCKDTTKRMSSQEALKHEWIMNYETANEQDMLIKTKDLLKNFNYSNKLHKILVNAVLEEIDREDKKVILNSLHMLDSQKNGLINECDIVQYIVSNSNIAKMDHKRAVAKAQMIMKAVKIKKNNSIPIDDLVKHMSVGNGSRASVTGGKSPRGGGYSGKHNNFSSAASVHSNVSSAQDEFKYDHKSDDDDQELDGLQAPTDLEKEVSLSVEAFREIMYKSPKKYAVDSLVNQLDPTKTGFISFETISKFSNNIKTLSYDAYENADLPVVDDDDDLYDDNK